MECVSAFEQNQRRPRSDFNVAEAAKADFPARSKRSDPCGIPSAKEEFCFFQHRPTSRIAIGLRLLIKFGFGMLRLSGRKD